jgi:hypothetical protein
MAVLVAAACTSFSAAPSADGPPADAGRPGPEPDAGADSSVSTCKSALCSDFSASPVWTGWTLDDYSRTGGGTLSRYDGDSTSPPSSLAVELPPYDPDTWDGGGPGGGRARLCKSFHAASRLKLAFAMRVLALDATTTIAPASLRFGYQKASGDTLYVDLETEPSTGWLLVQSASKQGRDTPVALSPTLSLDQWVHVELEASVGPSDAGRSSVYSVVRIDGALAAERTKEWAAPDGDDSEVCIGITYVARSEKPIRILYDDVTVDMTPR